jgi:drug/metabolite transporter (DMT)-like permease
MRTSRLALAIAVVLWASAFPAIRVGLAGLGVAGLALLRVAAAAVVLAVVAPLLHVRLPRARDLPLIAVCGASGISGYSLLLNWGEVHVPAGTASLLVASAPVFSVLLGQAFLGEDLTTRTVIGSAIALAGAAVIAGGLHLSSSALVVLVASVVQGTYHAASKPLLARYTSVELACYAIWCGTVFLAPLLPMTLRTLGHAPASALLAAGYLGLLPSALGFVAWGYAVARLPLAVSTASLYLVPPVAVLVANVWLGETPHVLEIVGGLISIGGVFLINHRRPGSDLVPPGREELASLRPSAGKPPGGRGTHVAGGCNLGL